MLDPGEGDEVGRLAGDEAHQTRSKVGLVDAAVDRIVGVLPPPPHLPEGPHHLAALGPLRTCAGTFVAIGTCTKGRGQVVEAELAALVERGNRSHESKSVPGAADMPRRFISCTKAIRGSFSSRLASKVYSLARVGFVPPGRIRVHGACLQPTAEIYRGHPTDIVR